MQMHTNCQCRAIAGEWSDHHWRSLNTIDAELRVHSMYLPLPPEPEGRRARPLLVLPKGTSSKAISRSPRRRCRSRNWQLGRYCGSDVVSVAVPFRFAPVTPPSTMVQLQPAVCGPTSPLLRSRTAGAILGARWCRVSGISPSAHRSDGHLDDPSCRQGQQRSRPPRD